MPKSKKEPSEDLVYLEMDTIKTKSKKTSWLEKSGSGTPYTKFLGH